MKCSLRINAITAPAAKPKCNAGILRFLCIPMTVINILLSVLLVYPAKKLKSACTTIYINDKPLTLLQQPLKQGVQVTETDGKRSWNVVWSKPNLALPKTEMIIPNGHMFALGDNRSASHDSRFYGAVPLADVIGSAVCVALG